MNPRIKNLPFVAKLVLMFGMWFFNIVLATYLAIMLVKPLFGIDEVTDLLQGIPKTPTEVNAFLFVQVLSSIFGFLITAIMFAKLEWGSARERLQMGAAPVKMLLLAIVAIVIAQFFIEFLVDLNNKIPLPASLSFLRDAQKQAEDMINSLLNFHSPVQFVVVSVVLALIPAVAEEFFFRGLLLGGLLRVKANPALAIIVTGLIFSVSHMEFDNTLAIWLLGIFLGYLYYVSGSLWVPVAAHFTNNFLQVLFKYLYNTGAISKDIADATMPVYVTIISVMLFAGCIYLFDQWQKPAIYPEADPAPEQPADWMK